MHVRCADQSSTQVEVCGGAYLPTLVRLLYDNISVIRSISETLQKCGSSSVLYALCFIHLA